MTAAVSARLDALGVVDLLAVVLAGLPVLPGAACREQRVVFAAAEDGDPGAVEAAQAICATCPAVGACTAWLSSLPEADRPLGVVGGQQIEAPQSRRPGRPRKAVAS